MRQSAKPMQCCYSGLEVSTAIIRRRMTKGIRVEIRTCSSSRRQSLLVVVAVTIVVVVEDRFAQYKVGGPRLDAAVTVVAVAPLDRYTEARAYRRGFIPGTR